MSTIRPECLAKIDQLAKEKIEVFEKDLHADGSSRTGLLKSIQSLSDHIASDYGDRYLLELIQNACDSLGHVGDDGKIKIYFAPKEGSYGTLYVANGGTPFLDNNLKSICIIGESGKPPGENIGNKGLGFRSITHVCDNPEIYSLDSNSISSGEFGYCFRFAHDNDLARWTDNEVALVHLPQQLPSFCIPFPLDAIPPTIARLINEGFVTIIKLPLRDRYALRSVCSKIKALRNGTSPLVLFLKKLSRLDVIVEGHEKRSFNFERKTTHISLSEGVLKASFNLTIVELNEGQRYCVLWHYVPEDRVKAKISESIHKKQLHPSWEKWQGNGELALAVSLEEPLAKGLLYTFLPMGDAAESPFVGHLHGAFFPKSERTSLHAESPLNAMYVEEALKLSADGVSIIRALASTQGACLTYGECGRAIVDLLSWRTVPSITNFSGIDYVKKIEAAFSAAGGEIGKLDILPVIHGDKVAAWGTPIDAWEWDDCNFDIFTSKYISKLGDVRILSGSLGSEKVAVFKSIWKDRIKKQLFVPDAEELASVVERVAEQLIINKADIELWHKFYQELYVIIKKYEHIPLPAALATKKILFCSGNRLLAGISQAPSVVIGKAKRKKKGRPVQNIGTVVFSPSDRLLKGSSEDVVIKQLLAVPRELEHGFSFLSQKLDWYGDLDDVRTFFEKQRLVRKYDAREIIVNVSRIQRESDDKIVRRQALSWLFALYLARGDDLAEALTSAEIYVPVGRVGWTSARNAYFSRGWNPSGKINVLLDQFIESASPYSEEISGLRKHLLIPPTKKPFALGKSSEWYAFLRLIGVNVGLHPIVLDSKKISSISNVAIRNVGALLKLNDETIKVWEEEAGKVQISYAGNNLIDKSSVLLYWPGQGDLAKYPSDIKRINARLLLEWVAKTDYSDHDLKIRYSHNYYCNAQRFEWPNPLLAYLRGAEWFPVENIVGDHKGLVFKRLRDVWLLEENGRNRPFMPQIPLEHGTRHSIIPEEVSSRLRSWGKANVLNDPRCLVKQVAVLGRIFNDNQVEDYCRREFINLYAATWKMLADNGFGRWGSHERPEFIIVRNKGVYRALPVAAEKHGHDDEYNGARNVYISEDGKSLVCALLEELGQDVFDFETNNPRVINLIKDLLGPQFIATSSLPVEILVDGASFDAAKEGKTSLVDLFPSYPALLCLAMECLTGTSSQQLPADRGEMLARLRQVRVLMCSEISFKISGEPKPIPQSYYGVLGHMDEDTPCLIVETENDQLTWAHMRDAGPALCRLLGQSDLASAIKIACSAMERQKVANNCKFTRGEHLEFLCRDLGISKAQAETALAIEAGDKRRVESLLRPLVLYFVGLDAYRKFDGIRERTTTLVELIGETRTLFNDSDTTLDSIYECVKEANNYEYIQRKLRLDFAKFNTCLVTTDGAGSAITYPDDHKREMKEFIENHRNEIVSCLRSSYLNTYDQQGNLDEYVNRKQKMLAMPPNESWLLLYEIPSTALMHEHINNHLKNYGLQRLEDADITHFKWSEVVKCNDKAIREFASKYSKTIHAWCDVNTVNDEIWAVVEPDVSAIKSVLDKFGALDFRELDDESLIKWMIKAGVWPSGMPAAVDLESLNLTEENIAQKEKDAAERRGQQEKANRSVKFGSAVIDPRDANYENLSDLMKAGLPKEFLKTPLGSYADVHKVEGGAPGGSPNKDKGKQGDKRGAPAKLPQEKTELIGFLGECAVYHWLQKLFPKKDIESTWKSENRKRLFADNGNDLLGYDFCLEYDRKTWLIEVKASMQNPMTFEMGETEVVMAKEVVVSGKAKYVIAYVCNLEDPVNMRICVLPNPFSEEGRAAFGKPKEKFRYSFKQ